MKANIGFKSKIKEEAAKSSFVSSKPMQQKIVFMETGIAIYAFLSIC